MMLEKTAAEEQIERGETTLVGRCSDDIPFGIRALTEDPEVEGVWNSRAVTALHRPAMQPSCASISLRSSGKTRKGSSASSTSLHNPANVGLASPNGKAISAFFAIWLTVTSVATPHGLTYQGWADSRSATLTKDG